MTYRRKDSFYRRARDAGYRARSAYKLAELAERFRLLRRGDRVVDLGAWPGGWLQVVLERIGPAGRAVGVDLAPIEPLPAANVQLITGDVRDAKVQDEVLAALGGAADVVLSDLAPKLSGISATDEARWLEVATAARDALPRLLARDGRFLMKLFMSKEHEAVVARLRGSFAEVRTTRPEATRKGSSEIYAIGIGYRPGPG
jgi:23S rRNA (uridine2552-2'-O)-methyltransferase